MAKQKDQTQFNPDKFKDWIFPMNGGPGEEMRELIAVNRRAKSILAPGKKPKHASATIGTVLDAEQADVNKRW